MMQNLRCVRIATLALGVLLVLSSGGYARSLAYTISAVLPHDQMAFTQGLLFSGGYLYESTGLNGRSSLRKVEPTTGKVLRLVELDREDFGEGLALWGGQFYQLTWRNSRVHVYDASTLERVRTLPFQGEGWGVASTPFGLVTSDGSATLTWRDPATMLPTRILNVSDAGRPVARLNELEWVDGFILANVWHEDRIAFISPATGQVVAWMDCAPLRARLGTLDEDSVLNGIAWNPATRKLYVTGKLWPAIFELALEGLPKQ